jgi:hypothetical protein
MTSLPINPGRLMDYRCHVPRQEIGTSLPSDVRRVRESGLLDVYSPGSPTEQDSRLPGQILALARLGMHDCIIGQPREISYHAHLLKQFASWGSCIVSLHHGDRACTCVQSSWTLSQGTRCLVGTQCVNRISSMKVKAIQERYGFEEVQAQTLLNRATGKRRALRRRLATVVLHSLPILSCPVL